MIINKKALNCNNLIYNFKINYLLKIKKLLNIVLQIKKYYFNFIIL